MNNIRHIRQIKQKIKQEYYRQITLILKTDVNSKNKRMRVNISFPSYKLQL